MATDGTLDLLWTDAPRYREPSGVLEASVIEMPLVEIGAGEFVEMPSGRVVEGGRCRPEGANRTLRPHRNGVRRA
jgi:hypothetical protein